MNMRESAHDSIPRLRRLALVALCALSLSVSAAEAKKRKPALDPPVEQSSEQSAEPSADQPTDPSTEEMVDQSEKSVVDQSDTGIVTSSSRPPLQGKTEVIEILLDEEPLYRAAMASIEKEDYNQAIHYLQQLIPQLGEGYEPYRAECMYYEAGCHQMLKRMNAAKDTYKKAFDLFAQYDSSNPLKDNCFKLLASLSGSAPLTGNIQQENIVLVPRKAQFAIDPNAVLAVRDNNRDIPLLEVNDRSVLPRIVKECFNDMTCLETAEIGSNAENAVGRWVPLMVHGKTAAFGMNGSAHPAFRANVNGRSYLFDVILPDMQPGVRKILLVTDAEKICAVDVDNFDTWLLRMQRAKDGRVTTARWYKLTHTKDRAPFISPVAGTEQLKRNPASRRNW